MNLVNFFWLVEKFVIILNSRLVICNTTHFNQYMVKNQSKKHDFFPHRIFFIYILKMLVNSGLHWLLTCDEKDNKNTWKYDMNTSVAKARRVLPASHLLRRTVRRRQSLCKLCSRLKLASPISFSDKNVIWQQSSTGHGCWVYSNAHYIPFHLGSSWDDVKKNSQKTFAGNFN